MKIKTYTGDVDPGFQGYTQQGVVDKSAQFEGADLAGFANLAQTGIKGAIAVDQTNKLAFVADTTSQIAQEYLDRSPTEMNALREEAKAIESNIPYTTDELEKSELKTRLAEIQNKYKSALDQGKMDPYEISRRLNAEIGPMMRNNPHLADKIGRQVNRHLQISGVNAAIKFDNAMLSQARSERSALEGKLDTYILNNNLFTTADMTFEDKQALVSEHSAGKQLLQDAEDEKKIRELMNEDNLNKFIDAGGPLIMYNTAMRELTNQLANIIDSSYGPTQKVNLLQTTVDNYQTSLLSKFSKFKDDPRLNKFTERFKTTSNNLLATAQGDVTGSNLKEYTNNILQIEKDNQELATIGLVSPVVTEGLASVTQAINAIDNAKAGDKGTKSNLVNRLVLVGGKYLDALNIPTTSTSNNLKNPELTSDGKPVVINATEKLMSINNAVDSNGNVEPFVVNTHKHREALIKDIDNSFVQVQMLDENMKSYASPAYKDKLQSLLKIDSEYENLFDDNMKQYTQFIKEAGLPRVMKDQNINNLSAFNLKLNPVTGNLESDNTAFMTTVGNRINLQINLRKNIDADKEGSVVGATFVSAMYPELFSAMNNKDSFDVDISDASPIGIDLSQNDMPQTDESVVEEGKVPTEQEEQVMQNIFNYKKGDGSNEFRTYTTKEEAVKDVANQIDRYVKGLGVAKGRPAVDIRTFLNLYRPASDYQGGDDVTQKGYEDFLVSQVLPEGSTATTPITLTDSDYIAKLLKALAKQETGTNLTIEEIQGYLK